MEHFIDARAREGASPEGVYKRALAESPRLMLGLNCLEPGQAQSVHAHEGEDKFYFVLAGRGEFTVGDLTQTAPVGTLVWAPAGAAHGVENRGGERLVLLMGMAPPPG